MTAKLVSQFVGSIDGEMRCFWRLTVRGEEASVASTLDNLSSWLGYPKIYEFFDRRDAVRNVERPTFPEKLLDIFLSITRGSSVIR